MTGGSTLRWFRGGLRSLVVVLACSATVLAMTVGPARAAGGPVILGGDDLTDHGNRNTTTNVNELGWLYLERALENVAPAVTRPANNGSIAALGSADNATPTQFDAGAAIHFAAQDAGAGIPVTYYDGGPAIDQFFADLRAGTVNPAIIWIAGDGADNDLDLTESTALANNATTIGDFVNSGGGLVSHGSEYGWLTGLFPGASSVFSGSGSLMLTPQGQAAFPGLTDADVNAGPWHSHFEGNLGGLATLVSATTANDSTGADARVIVGGVGVVLPGSIVLDPPTDVNLLGTSHTVTATVRNDVGQLLPGATVTFTVTSGPNAGDTVMAVTDAVGQASFTWVGDGGAGTDIVQASFVDAAGATRSATATKDWVAVLPIPVIPAAGIPIALATTAAAATAAAVAWRHRKRRPARA